MNYIRLSKGSLINDVGMSKQIQINVKFNKSKMKNEEKKL